jgi:hypothetical protein
MVFAQIGWVNHQKGSLMVTLVTGRHLTRGQLPNATKIYEYLIVICSFADLIRNHAVFVKFAKELAILFPNLYLGSPSFM